MKNCFLTQLSCLLLAVTGDFAIAQPNSGVAYNGAIEYFLTQPTTAPPLYLGLPSDISIAYLWLPISVKEQVGPCPIAQEEPKEIKPIESLIHYPKEAKKNGIEGWVTMEALIEKDGSISKVHILKSSNSIFNQEAIRAMKSARFTPVMGDNDRPIRLWITRAIKFRLKSNAQSQKAPRMTVNDSTRTLK